MAIDPPANLVPLSTCDEYVLVKIPPELRAPLAEARALLGLTDAAAAVSTALYLAFVELPLLQMMRGMKP